MATMLIHLHVKIFEIISRPNSFNILKFGMKQPELIHNLEIWHEATRTNS